MQKRELILALARTTSRTVKEADKFLSGLTEAITDDLSQSGKTLISGLGTFQVRHRDEKRTPNPQNPEEYLFIPKRKAVTYTPGTTLKQIVRNQPKEESSMSADDVLGKLDHASKNPTTESTKTQTDAISSPANSGEIEQKIYGEQKSKASAIPYIDLSEREVPKEILAKVPEYLAQLYQAVPVEERDGKVLVAMVDPEDFQAINFIRKAIGKNIEIGLTTKKDIAHVLAQYSGLQSKIEKVIAKSPTEETSPVKATKQDKKEAVQDDSPIAKIVSSILQNAINLEASDIHIEPKEKEIQVRFRIDGVLTKNVVLPKKIQAAVTSRIKILCNMKIDEQRLPQDGRFKIETGKPVDFRVSTFPTVFGEKIVMRILDKSQGILSMEELGITGRNLEVIRNGIQKPHGMTLVTGPTGSGKTTTLYAVLKELMGEAINIITLEDPVEYQIVDINQGQVKSEIGFTFASGLRSIVRQDPDVIMVGEVRDLETAELAVQAALTGHIVLSTLHTNDAAGAIPRLIDMGVEPFLITSSINSIVAQRLARKVCEGCKIEAKIEPQILEDIKRSVDTLPPKTKAEYAGKALKFLTGKGCSRCNNTGYKKRIGIFEILELTDKVKELALQKVSASDLAKQAHMDGMISMKQDGILKALSGITSIEEVWRVTKE